MARRNEIRGGQGDAENRDKTLDAEKVQVSVEPEGTVIHKGLVPDLAAKEKAVSLVRDTRGVVQVIDHLAIPPTPRIVDAPADGNNVEPATIAERSISRR
jgi:hypothetical protein